MLAVILMGSLTSENPSDAEIRIFTKPRFTILLGQLQSYAHRLGIKHFLWVLKTLLNYSYPTLRNALLKFFHRWFQIHLISSILFYSVAPEGPGFSMRVGMSKKGLYQHAQGVNAPQKSLVESRQ